jgi:hypothetical protein
MGFRTGIEIERIGLRLDRIIEPATALSLLVAVGTV